MFLQNLLEYDSGAFLAAGIQMVESLQVADGMGMALKIEFVPKQKVCSYDFTGMLSGEVILRLRLQ